MSNNYIIKKLNISLLPLHTINKKSKLDGLVSSYKQQDAGFSLIEVVAVVLMIGILAAIVGPSWLVFVNRQQLNKANDAVLVALQQANREAKRTKTSYSFTFKVENKIAKIAVHPSDSIPANNSPLWQTLGSDAGITSGQVTLLTNLTGTNKTDDNGKLNKLYNYLATQQSIKFDYLGSLPDAYFGKEDTTTKDTPGLKIAVVRQNAGTSASDADMKRCVIIKTLLSGIVVEKDSKCN
ncbi:prepilin-type cleavage/methylation domain-containing protein [Nostoc sp. CENA543]|uniref:pilus assembly FimT family protein n=1 Tax=Nostoc sp. CENA543 TaxID=1869241 RepID=UPI000CA31ED8|nr:prepilin-type N-terminal cleavage/methylation domain-containing protein [Nostoc sp. CENA543]AUT02462.1 prepilin-type cleavage/methylation domain-containing protein [Nostoc sp. CENA543]